MNPPINTQCQCNISSTENDLKDDLLNPAGLASLLGTRGLDERQSREEDRYVRDVFVPLHIEKKNRLAQRAV